MGGYMKLKVIGSNMTEVELHGYTTVFFSYNTPVAAWLNGNFYVTDKHWSRTTTKHINKWLTHFTGINDASLVIMINKPQEFFDSLEKNV